MSDQNILFYKDALLTRAVTIELPKEVLSVLFDEAHLGDSIQCGPNVTSEKRLQLRNLRDKYNDCFSSGLNGLGLTTAGEMIIELENSEPVVYRPYRMSVAEKSLVRGMVGEMIDAGIVKESSSPYASPIVLVKKKTGEKLSRIKPAH